MCMQPAEPNYGAVTTRMQSQRIAGLEQEIDDLKKKLTACLRENVNLQEELSESYHIKLPNLHANEPSKSLEAEKQIKFFQSSVAAAFFERDNAIMEFSIGRISQRERRTRITTIWHFATKVCIYIFIYLVSLLCSLIWWTGIEELDSVVLEEKEHSATLQTDLEKLKKENVIFKQATVHAIASHLGDRVCEWNTPTPTIWQEHIHTMNTCILIFKYFCLC